MKKNYFNNAIILVTGSSGFIGSNLCKKMLMKYNNITIIGLDSMNNYYDVKIKEARLEELQRKYS